jgi:histone acetyltransferase (RNA polymerase elongator complex component)
MIPYIIPIFVPQMGCPFQCIFCDQKKISGSDGKVDVTETISAYLKTMPGHSGDQKTQVAFYGGSFTAINKARQIEFLSKVQPFIKSGKVDSIRISTRPDFIDKDILRYLKEYGVTTIELGAQSLSDQVLKASRRGYLQEAVFLSSKLIKESGFKLGIQLMIGLPAETDARIEGTVLKTINLEPDFTRIYPTVVIKDTKLHEMYLWGHYFPLSLDEAIETCSKMYMKFRQHRIGVIRMGLQPTETLEKEFLVAGPFHPAFGELVLSLVAYKMMDEHLVKLKKPGGINYLVPDKQLSIFLGQKRKNLIKLRQKYDCQVTIKGDYSLQPGAFIMDTVGERQIVRHPYF